MGAFPFSTLPNFHHSAEFLSFCICMMLVVTNTNCFFFFYQAPLASVDMEDVMERGEGSPFVDALLARTSQF